MRKAGYGGDCDWSQVKDEGNHSLWDTSDFRRTCGGSILSKTHAVYTAFHFHNFFTDFNVTRHKMKTYGHPNPLATVGILRERRTAIPTEMQNYN